MPARWLRCPRPRPDARARLFCFPHAGAGATTYVSWAQHLPEDVEVWAVQLPGREERSREPAFTHLAPLLDALEPALRGAAAAPFALYGHSMGALIAFEVARRAEAAWGHGPVLLAVSGLAAPDRPRAGPPLHELPDDELLAHLAQHEGEHDGLADPSVRASVLPTLRADLAICERYVFTQGPPLRCPISAFVGTRDTTVAPAGLARWGFHTRRGFQTRALPGAHFFHDASRRQMLDALRQDLTVALD